jgi:CDGSH-type Zn-finger protein
VTHFPDDAPEPDRRRVTVTPYKDGPLLLRGAVELLTQEGEPIGTERTPVALCRCGRSAVKPFCDGSHKAAGFRAPSATEIAARGRSREDRATDDTGERAMGHRMTAGVLAGAAGVTALNAVTYLDMVLRGRPASRVPERLVDIAAGRAGLELGAGDTASNRRQGLAALLGYGVGLGVGSAYALAGARILGRRATASVVLAVAASIAGGGPATALGLTDPRTWSSGDWLSDIAPHLAYGIVTVAAYDRMTRHRPDGRRPAWRAGLPCRFGGA